MDGPFVVLEQVLALVTQIKIMITQYEVPSLMKASLSVWEEKVYPGSVTLDVYRSMHYFTDYTKKAVEEHHLITAKKCFRLADQLYHYGDSVVRMCIENIFIFSFTSFIPKDRIERLILQSFIPASLHEAYVKQVSTSGC